ncbi:MAG TPA: L-threonylcarbamoyladenylate synthase [Burkholderiaceae bacterium]|nr:L-threonylcarbamoyladenylate synthase [Burkholderiaceae bacterium]
MAIVSGASGEGIEQAAQRLADGGLVALPTETVYGLAARADDDDAVAKIFAAKGRPADHPLIVHVRGRDEALAFADGLSDAAERLIAAFWPGPVTVIVRRAPGRAGAAAAGAPTVALRSPAHPVARAVLERCAQLGVQGLAAPSANRFGRVSPTTAAHVSDEFGPDLLVLDGGPCELGIESAIVDCSGAAPVLLRPGVITRERLEQALGTPLREADAESPRAPGTLESHYAPRATLRLMSSSEMKAALQVLPATIQGLAVYSRTAARRHPLVQVMPDDPQAVARELFAVLRAFDDRGVKLIWVEQPPDTPDWEGVNDRLQRAAAH